MPPSGHKKDFVSDNIACHYCWLIKNNENLSVSVSCAGFGFWLWQWDVHMAWKGSDTGTEESGLSAGQAPVERHLRLHKLWYQSTRPRRMQPTHTQVWKAWLDTYSIPYIQPPDHSQGLHFQIVLQIITKHKIVLHLNKCKRCNIYLLVYWCGYLKQTQRDPLEPEGLGWIWAAF